MKKYKELFKNIGLLTLSNFGSKLLCFFLVPLYTAVLTTKEYGEFDFISVTISLLVPLLTLCIYESALRFLLDKDSDKKNVCNISLKIVLFSIIYFALIVFINYIFNIIPIFNQYIIYFILYYIASVFYQYTSNVVRGYNKINVLAIGGILSSVVMLGSNIVFLLVFDWGINGYFAANILANMISSIYMLIHTKIYTIFSLKVKDDGLKKEMVKYSKPLMLNSIGWWVNSASDRYTVTYICGSEANGVYSIAYKIPSILSIFQSIFNQAWGISAVKEFDKDDRDGYFAKAYSVYNMLMIFVCSSLIIFTKLLAKILYKKEFYLAWEYVPFLMFSVVFGAMSGFLGGVFSAVKKSNILGRTTILGAILNLILNIIMVWYFGPIGAAIATFISYFVVWAIRMFAVRKYINLKLQIKKDLFIYLIILLQCSLFIFVEDNYILYSCQAFALLIEFLVYFKEIKKLIKKIFDKREETEVV